MSELESKSRSARGAPPGSSADDEFGHIPGQRRRPPLLTLLTIAVAVFLIVRLRQDVSYALSSATPIELGEARTLGGEAAGRLPMNRYVRLSGLPERESAVILDPRGAWEFSQLFRLHGTGGRFFVRRSADPLPIALAERDVFTGRLMRFAELSFAESIARHFADRVTASHFFRASELAAALTRPDRPLTLRDVAGQRVTLPPSTRLTLDLMQPGEYRVELPRERFAEASAAQALVQRAAQAAGGRVLHMRETPGAWIVTLAISPDARDRTLGALGALDPGIQFRAARDTLEVELGALRASPQGFDLGAQAGGAGPVPVERVVSIRTLTAVQIPADAVLLLEAERPGGQIKSMVILGVLVLFGTVSLLALRRPA